MADERLHKNVKISGWGSLLTDMSTEMIMPVLPTFIVAVLKAPVTALGLIEGIAESTASLLKLASGYISDRIGKRKPLIILGYSFSALVKPLLALATGWIFVLAIRFFDRVGKGIRTSPRDALIADSSGKKKGKPFGFQRFMDTTGAATGSLIAFIILRHFNASINSYRLIFLISFIPALAAVIVLLGLKEIARTNNPDNKSSIQKPSFKTLPRRFKYFLIVSFIFTLSNFSYAFYLIRAKSAGIADWTLPLLYLINTVSYALFAYPSGIASDRLGARNLLGTGYLVYLMTALMFAFIDLSWFPFLGFVLYGLYQALVDTNSRIVVAELSDEETRGTAYGSYHTAVGIAALPSSLFAGIIWQKLGGKASFVYGAILSLIALVMLITISKEKSQKKIATLGELEGKNELQGDQSPTRE